jgi:hypothetical protein
MDRNEAATKGPTTCEKFNKLKPLGGCDGCPFKGEIKSPIVLGRSQMSLILPNKQPVVLK